MIKVIEDYKLVAYTCKKCDHKWIPRIIKPKQCPSCKSAYWK